MPYIDRDMAIKALIDEGRNVDSRYLESERIIHESDAIEAISMLPTADVVERKKGKWIDEPFGSYRCSVCDSHYPSDMDFIFCPHCGAYVGEETEDDKSRMDK